jgi:energy-coupling factor transporter ATP-binding protein EcfA2
MEKSGGIIDKLNPQEHLGSLLEELGSPWRWTQEKAFRFYSNYLNGGIFDNRLLLEIKDIKEQPNFTIYRADVLNPSDFTPFTLSFNGDKWIISFKVSKNNTQYKVNEIITATAEELKLDKLPNENKIIELISINPYSIKAASLETDFNVFFGVDNTKRILQQFGSLERIAPLIISKIEALIEDDIDRLIKEKEEREFQLEAGLKKKENELFAKFKGQEINLQTEHEDKLEELKKEIDKIERKMKKLKGKHKQLEDEEQELNIRNEKLKELDATLENEANLLVEHKRFLESQFNEYRLIHPLLDNYSVNIDHSKTISWGEQEDIIDTIRGALHEQCNLQYERDVIECFVGGLMTNQLIILHGPSGTGKSSLVSNFANIMANAKTLTVRVQSSWTDKQDLLGFLNPIDYQYISTPFLDALVEAKGNPGSLYLICLDEMNLAHVEYYFAEFLSAREEKPPNVTLYSKHFQKLAMDIIQSYIFTNESGLPILDVERMKLLNNESDRIRLQNCYDLCYRYTADFLIPNNVRFIGTMNLDLTVKSLSPKIIDRSLVIEIDYPADEEALIQELDNSKVQDLIIIDIEKNLSINKINKEYRKVVQELNPILQRLDTKSKLNRRALDHIGYFAEGINSDEILDLIVKTKILPRIDVLHNAETESIFRELILKLEISGHTMKRIEKMKDGGRTISYWR